MQRVGVLLLVFGIGAFVLPLVGLEFRVFRLFGESTRIAGLAFIAIGAALLGIPMLSKKGTGD